MVRVSFTGFCRDQLTFHQASLSWIYWKEFHAIQPELDELN